MRERRAADPIVPLRLFANRAFATAGASAFMVGTAMFGAITFLPLYLQVVDGASATVAGLRMLPFVIGALVASAISGKLISKAERYKPYPIAGAGADDGRHAAAVRARPGLLGRRWPRSTC